MSESISNSSDEELIQQVLAGEREFFGELVRRHQDRLFGEMFGILRNRTDAEDVVQVAFVNAYKSLGTFRGGSAFFTWLYRIAFNQAMTVIRGRRPNVSPYPPVREMGLDFSVRNSTPSAAMEQRERADQVNRALEQLPESLQQILRLREIEGLDYAAISQILNVPLGTVRSRLSRARDQLREQLNLIDQR
jgi:RNA polymerase sigma-70 factor (ECF subfamily)